MILLDASKLQPNYLFTVAQYKTQLSFFHTFVSNEVYSLLSQANIVMHLVRITLCEGEVLNHF